MTIDVQEIINALLGSCMTLNEGGKQVCGDEFEEENLTRDQRLEISEQIFKCDTCSWWFERGEQSPDPGDEICESCYDPQGEQ